MFGETIRRIIVSVISSWQVWAVTIALVCYFVIVKAASTIKSGGRSRRPSLPRLRVKKTKAAPPAISKTDDLGLEEGVEGGESSEGVVVEEE